MTETAVAERVALTPGVYDDVPAEEYLRDPAFLRRYESKYVARADGSCWIWMGARTAAGYGALSRGRRGAGTVYAHVVSHQIHKGPVPAGHQVDHVCRVRACVNPAHLEAVSQVENLHRQAAAAALRTHCARGHRFESLPAGRRRYCKACSRDRYRRKAGAK